MSKTFILENSIATNRGVTYSDRLTSFREIEALLCGKFIGSGASRHVYECQLDETRVIKHETEATFQNIIEWETWSRVRDSRISKWFAPCYALSPNGHYLVQAKVEPLRAGQTPKRVPAILSDCRRENFGLFEGRIVCCDYGSMLARISETPRLVRVKWD